MDRMMDKLQGERPLRRKSTAKKRLVLLITAVFLCSVLSGCTGQPAKELIRYTVSDQVTAPVFSVQSGAYADSFDLEITGKGDGQSIHYTLDGSIPDIASPEYRKPIRIINRSDEANVLSAAASSLFAPDVADFTPEKIRKCTVVRAACFDEAGFMSETVTATYLVGLPESHVKTVSLSLDSADLFDYERGIYVLGKAYDDWLKTDPKAKDTPAWEIPGNYSQRGREWERPVHADLIGADGKLLHSQELGLRIMGTATRTYYQKSFRLYARAEYGSKNIRTGLIDGLTRERDGRPLEKFKSIVLRNGGNDNQSCMLRDPFIQKLAGRCRFSTQGTEPCEVYIDGEYWGLYAITEDYSDDYIADNYDIEKSNVVMIKAGELEEGETEDSELYQSLMEKIAGADFTDPGDYEWICGTMDLDSFIDYTAVNIYIDNNDGIFGNEGENNWRMWRCRVPEEDNEYGDGRWRFMMYGAEYSLGLYSLYGEEPDYDEDTLGIILERPETGFTGLFKKLLKNDDFRCRFVTRFEELRENLFHPEHSLLLLDEMEARYCPLMEEQIRRNGPDWAIQYFETAENFFHYYVDVVRNYLTGRYEYSETMLNIHFNVPEELAVYKKQNSR